MICPRLNLWFIVITLILTNMSDLWFEVLEICTIYVSRSYVVWSLMYLPNLWLNHSNTSSQIVLKLYGFPNFRPWAYWMKVIPETFFHDKVECEVWRTCLIYNSLSSCEVYVICTYLTFVSWNALRYRLYRRGYRRRTDNIMKGTHNDLLHITQKTKDWEIRDS
jgi:hypothetical protein